MEQILLKIISGNRPETLIFEEVENGDFPGIKWTVSGNTFISFPMETYMFLYARQYTTKFVKYVKLSGEQKYVLHTTYNKEVSDTTYVNAYTGAYEPEPYETFDDITKPIFDSENIVIIGYEQKTQLKATSQIETRFFINNVGISNNLALFPTYIATMAKHEGFM